MDPFISAKNILTRLFKEIMKKSYFVVCLNSESEENHILLTFSLLTWATKNYTVYFLPSILFFCTEYIVAIERWPAMTSTCWSTYIDEIILNASENLSFLTLLCDDE